jgi:hypothetical protein
MKANMTKGLFGGQVIFPTNKIKFDIDKKWEDLANPNLKLI